MTNSLRRQDELNKLRADVVALRALLLRIRQWDQLPETADGPYWMRVIDEELAK